MTYVMSDLHGMYDRFIAMLEKIDFSDSDELFIIGAVSYTHLDVYKRQS